MAGARPVPHWRHHVCPLSQGELSSPDPLSQHLSLVKVEDYLGEHPDVTTLTAMFFFLNFLAATQDIAVDGWALTMLQVVGQSSILSLLSHLLRGTMLAMPPPAIPWGRQLAISWATSSSWPSSPMAL